MIAIVRGLVFDRWIWSITHPLLTILARHTDILIPAFQHFAHTAQF